MHSVLHNVLTDPSINGFRPVQGFVDNNGKFLTRSEAYEVALAAGQIRHKTGNPSSKELFSEDLY
jgi:hypothetical protein